MLYLSISKLIVLEPIRFIFEKDYLRQIEALSEGTKIQKII